MNWLSHLYLSEPTAEFRLGNLLPDFLPNAALLSLPPEVLRGVERHRRIDSFTDRHPIVRQSIARISPPYRRFGGVLVDLFYDHFLIESWNQHATVPLDNFLKEAFGSIQTQYKRLPTDIVSIFQRMQSEGWLSSYGTIAGIELALARISNRFRRRTNLAPAARVLEKQYSDFQTDFALFFPQLKSYVTEEGRRTTGPCPSEGRFFD